MILVPHSLKWALRLKHCLRHMRLSLNALTMALKGLDMHSFSLPVTYTLEYDTRCYVASKDILHQKLLDPAIILLE